MSRYILALSVLLGLAPVSAEDDGSSLVLTDYRHATEYAQSQLMSVDYELGLGALQKVGGRWRHKNSELVQGDLNRHTWEITQPYSAGEAYRWYVQQLLDLQAEQLFQCQGRSCGSSAQWANRVFSQRVLYGYDERQQYSAWRLVSSDIMYTVVLYAVDRANRRHYLQLDILAQPGLNKTSSPVIGTLLSE